LPVELRLENDDSTVFARIRSGAWASNGFEFRATRTDGIQVNSEGQALLSGGVDLGVAIHDRFVIFGTYEVSGTDDLFADLAGLYAGYRDRSEHGQGVPDEVTLYAGTILGRFEVKKEGFGDFEDAIGFGGGIDLTWHAARGLLFSVIGEYRLIEFEYHKDVLEGDKQAGGSGVWAGLALDFRF
jgi:hypothetical protein